MLTCETYTPESHFKDRQLGGNTIPPLPDVIRASYLWVMRSYLFWQLEHRLWKCPKVFKLSQTEYAPKPPFSGKQWLISDGRNRDHEYDHVKFLQA